jgi:plasmid stabilization system protein ParE
MVAIVRSSSNSYRIIYRLEGQEILIVTVVHGSRDLAGDDEKPWERT